RRHAAGDRARRHRRAPCRAGVRGAQRADRHLRQAAADRDDHRHRRHLFRHRPAVAALPGRRRQRGPRRHAHRPHRRLHPDEPRRAPGRHPRRLGAVQPLGDGSHGLCHRLVGGGRLHVGDADPPRQVPHLRAGRPARRDRRAVPHLLHLYGRGGAGERQRLYAVFHRRRRAWRRVALWRDGQRHRRGVRRARLPRHRRPSLRLRPRPAVATAFPGRRASRRRQPRGVRAASGAQQAGLVRMSDISSERGRNGILKRIDPAVATAFGCIVLLLLVGSIYSSNFLHLDYLLLQLKVASFLGVIATGMMLVILLGQIDLSAPWTITTGAMMSCAAAAYGPTGVALAIPFGILCGVLIGIVNGIGVAYLRIPAMIITLATNAVAQGLMVVYTGGFSPQDSATAAMRYLATGFTIPGVPNAVIIWALIGAAMVFVLTRSSFGRAVYGIGNRERAAYLSGIDTRRIVMIAFAVSGGLSAFGGVLLAGYASKAAQSMGDAYLLPSIAAVVLGGTSILGGRGSYLGKIG